MDAATVKPVFDVLQRDSDVIRMGSQMLGDAAPSGRAIFASEMEIVGHAGLAHSKPSNSKPPPPAHIEPGPGLSVSRCAGNEERGGAAPMEPNSQGQPNSHKSQGQVNFSR
jgi:hypothetical protein